MLSPQTPVVFFSLTILFFFAPRASVCTAVACVENFGSILITELPVASLCLFLLHPLCWEFYSLFGRPLVSFVLEAGFCTRSRVGLDSGSAHLSFLSTGVTGLSHSSFPKDLTCLLTDTWIHPSSTRRGQRLTLGIPHYLKHSVCVNVCGVYRWHSTHVEFRG